MPILTKQRPYDVMLGNKNALDPFDLTDEDIFRKEDWTSFIKLYRTEIYQQKQTSSILEAKQAKIQKYLMKTK